jgi:hypothetical protein
VGWLKTARPPTQNESEDPADGVAGGDSSAQRTSRAKRRTTDLSAGGGRQSEAGTLAASTLARHLRKAGASRKELLNETAEKGFRRFEAKDAHESWQFDFQHRLYLPDPKDAKKRKKAILFAILDDYSRYIVHAEFYWDEKLPRMEDSLKKGDSETWNPFPVLL